jgi:hypothetical protein
VENKKEMDCCVPEDIVKHLIFGFVDDLRFLDTKKQVLKNLALDVQESIVYDIIQRMDNLLEYISWTENDIKTSLYEKDYGPSGDYGDYYGANLEIEIKRYRNEITHWNTFVDDYEHLRPLMTMEQQEYFKKLTPQW